MVLISFCFFFLLSSLFDTLLLEKLILDSPLQYSFHSCRASKRLTSVFDPFDFFFLFRGSDRFQQTPLASSLSLLSPTLLAESTASTIVTRTTNNLDMSSTSAQDPSTKTQGECVVCGKICSTRCSSCAQHGVDWMYFCSTEHQRLVSLPVSPLLEIQTLDRFRNRSLISTSSQRQSLSPDLVRSQENVWGQLESVPMASTQ